MSSTPDPRSDLEIFLARHYLTTVFYKWYRSARQPANMPLLVWARASIHTLGLLEIKAHEDIEFVLQILRIRDDER